MINYKMTNAKFYLEDLKTKFNKINPKEYAPEFSNIKVIGCNTGMEFNEILNRIYKYSDKVLTPKISMTKIKENYGIPCFSKEQDFYIYYYQNSLRKAKEPSKTIKDKINGTYKTGFNISKKAKEYVLNGNAHKITHLCCHYLKKEPFRLYEKETGKKAILGVKGSESSLRKKQYTSCFSQNGKFSPLYDLTNELEDEIYKEFNIEIPQIYNYVERTGCVGCPYGSYCGDTKKELEYLKSTNKRQYEFVKTLFKESYNVLGIDV